MTGRRGDAETSARTDAEQSWRSLYPFESHYHALPGSSLRLHYLDERPATTHHSPLTTHQVPAVVMFHGNPTWSFYYRNLILALREKHRCIALDHIGCGLSDKPQDYPYTLKQHIDNAESLFDALNLRNVTLVLHDWGGAIGMGVAVRKPERIKRLVILNTAAFPSPRIPLRIAVCRIPGFGALAIRGLNGFARAALFMATAKPERFTPDVCAGLLAPYDSWANRVSHLRFVQDIPMKPSHPSWPVLKEIEAGLPQFKDRPMLICWGMQDWCFDPSFLKTWQDKFPQAEVVRFDDAGHYVLEDAYERIAPRVAEFLASTDSRL